jgi:hypothetical protein
MTKSIEFEPCLCDSPQFQLNISRVGLHLLKESLTTRG